MQKPQIRADGAHRYLLIGGLSRQFLEEPENNDQPRPVLSICRLDKDIELVFNHIFEDSSLKAITGIRIVSDWREKEVNEDMKLDKSKFMPSSRPRKSHGSSGRDPQAYTPLPTNPGQPTGVNPGQPTGANPGQPSGILNSPQIATMQPPTMIQEIIPPTTQCIDAILAMGQSALIVSINIDAKSISILYVLDSLHSGPINDMYPGPNCVFTVSDCDKIVNQILFNF